MKLDANIIVKYGDDPQKPGFNWVRAGFTWWDFFHRTTRFTKNSPLPREWADRFGKFAVWNPFGHETAPMKYDQCTRLRIRSLKEPLDADLTARADVGEFTRAVSAFPHWLLPYIGGPRTQTPREGETGKQWRNRALLEAAPYVRGGTFDLLGLDATLGYGRYPQAELFDAQEPLLLKQLSQRVPVAVEPTCTLDSGYLLKRPKILTQRFYEVRERKGDWLRQNMHVPGAAGEPVYLILDVAATTPQGKVDEINAAQQKWPEFNLIVAVSDLPVGVLAA